MNHILVNTVAVAVVLGVIVFVHELGHFLAAKAFGVRVETFSLGFGKRLLGLTYRGTDYRISVLPLGGYVKMAGENPLEDPGRPYPQLQTPGEFAPPPPTWQPDELPSKPRWQRFIIAFAGPAMNGILAVGLLIPVYMREYPRNPVLDKAAVIGMVQPDSPGSRAGLQPQDRIVSIDGAQNPTWETVFLKTAVSVDHPLPLQVERNGRTFHTQLTPVSDGPANPPEIGLVPRQQARFDETLPGSPARKAGLQTGDVAISVNGQPVLGPTDLVQRIQKAEPPADKSQLNATGRPVRLEVLRQGKTITLDIAPRLDTNAGHRQWMVGASFADETTYVKLPFREALHQSLEDNKQYSMVILDLVGKLVSHQASIQNLQGPVGIASVTGDAARASSILPLFSVTSLISLNLGILNLLPIPVLDGGMILFLLIEAITRHEISMKVKERVYQAGFAFLLILMTVVVYNDIVRAVISKP